LIMDAAARVKALARATGLDAVAITRADATPEAGDRLADFLAAGRHGEMAWMAREERRSPLALWPDAKSVIMLGLNYGPEDDPMAPRPKGAGAISVYARGRDYHDIFKGRLKTLAQTIVGREGGEVKVFVDTAPLMEKPLAAAAGLGWQGKHTNLVSREFGSWLFLGAILTTLDLAPDDPHKDHCGDCRRCLDICPTDAFPAPYQLDARRCISYLTIELKGQIPREFRAAIGDRIYGCDDCLAVCPWNKFAQTSRDTKLKAAEDRVAPSLATLAMMDDQAFRAAFSASPIKRTGRDRFVRNVAIAIGNSGDPSLVSVAAALLDDASALVRGAAIWALAALDPARASAEKRTRAGNESDPDARAEWDFVSP
jgi:epoxyqueuosine reductase